MKKLGFICLITLALSIFLLGCDGVSFTFTSFGGNTKIEVNNASDGAEGESQPISVGKDRSIVVKSSLDKGRLQIDFVEAIVFPATEDETEEIILGDVASSVEVASGGEATVSLERGDYVLQVKAIGETSGTVTLSVEKN